MLETTNKRNFGKQAGDLRDCADRRLVLCSQKVPIKSNCYKFPLCSYPLMSVFVQLQVKLAHEM